MRQHHKVEGKHTPFALIPAMPNLGTGTDDLKELTAHITEAMRDLQVPLRMIVIDTLRQATPGKSENDSKDMSVFLANCWKLAETFGCHVNFAHHAPRSNGERGSGTNAIDGAVDVMLSVARTDRDTPPCATITVKSLKDGEEGDSWTIQMHSVDVGKDGNREPKYGGYITIVEPLARHADAVAGKDTKKKLPASAKIALDALADALVEVGQKPPASTLIPRTVACVVHIDQWRQFAYRHGISKADTCKRAKQAAFSRAAGQLQSIGRVGCLDDYYWTIPRSRE
jgi:hypothetical protein